MIKRSITFPNLWCGRCGAILTWGRTSVLAQDGVWADIVAAVAHALQENAAW